MLHILYHIFLISKSDLSLAPIKMICTMPSMKNPAHNIYIHVPFCMSKCNYCAFFSRACANPDWGTYAQKICDEIDTWYQKLGKIAVPTIFFGGGTPSLMPANIFETIISKIYTLFDVAPDAEITVEANPKTISAEKLRDFVQIGANRLSIGVQSLDDETLTFLGRQHSARDAIELINAAQKMNIRTSADFIYGTPMDTVDSVVQLCTQINELGIRHCSMYELTIEPTTPFGKMNLQMPDNGAMAEMYDAIGKTLNLPRYEVSNYATHGNECKHNLNIWDGAPYIGLGQGAAGRVYMDNQWYEQMGNNERFEKISDNVRAIENVIMGMRTMRGCQLTDDVKNVIDIDWVQNNHELVKIIDDRIAPTDKGLMILDNILTNVVK